MIQALSQADAGWTLYNSSGNTTTLGAAGSTFPTMTSAATTTDLIATGYPAAVPTAPTIATTWNGASAAYTLDLTNTATATGLTQNSSFFSIGIFLVLNSSSLSQCTEIARAGGQIASTGTLAALGTGLTQTFATAAAFNTAFAGYKFGCVQVTTATALRTAAEFEQQLAGARQGFRSGLLLAVLYVVMAGVVVVGTSFFLTPLLLETEVFKRAGEEVDVGWVYLLFNLTTGVVALVLVALGVMTGIATVGRRLAPRQADRAMQRVQLYRNIALGVQNRVTFRELSPPVGGAWRRPGGRCLSDCRPPSRQRGGGGASRRRRTGCRWCRRPTTSAPR